LLLAGGRAANVRLTGRASGAPDRLSGIPDTDDAIPRRLLRRVSCEGPRAMPHARATLGASHRIACAVALVIAQGGGAGCAGSARGPPALSLDIALERARQALCSAGGVESPRALVSSLAPDDTCSQSSVSDRVRCYLRLSDTTVEVARVRGGYRLRFAIPQLSDHVHQVTVRRRGGGGRVDITVESWN
jgi:hypothetical protein